MEHSKFDDLTKALATATSRRQALKTIATTTLGTILGLSGIGIAFAKSCTPNGKHCNSKTVCCSGSYCANGKCTACPALPACNNSGCSCPTGQTCVNGSCCPTANVCGSTCLSTPCDPNQCQQCDQTSGTCVSSCAAGQSCCNGTCSDCACNQVKLDNGTCATPCNYPNYCFSFDCSCGCCYTDAATYQHYCTNESGSYSPCNQDIDCPQGQFCHFDLNGYNQCVNAC